MTHQQLVFTADSLRVAVTLIAPTEGRARFVAKSAGVIREAERGLPGALERLAEHCGYPLTATMASAAVVSGPPIRMRVIGEPNVADAAALDAVKRLGIATMIEPPGAPPRRPDRNASWFRPVIDAWADGSVEVLLIVIPPGVLPVWAAQILNGMRDVAPTGEARCVILASDAELTDVVPTGAALLLRDDHLTAHLTSILNPLRARRLLPGVPTDIPVISRPEALAAAVSALRAECTSPCVFLDVADGTTIVIADERGVVVHHEPEIDCSRGTLALLHRCGPERIARWIPFPIEERALRTWALRRASWPFALLVAREDREIATGFARAALSEVIETAQINMPGTASWVVGPALTQLGSPSVALHLVADLLPAAGVAGVVCDTDDLFTTVGALSFSYSADAAEVLAQDGRIPIGSIVRASWTNDRRGRSRQAAIVMDGQMTTVDVAADALITIACRGAATITLAGSTASRDEIAVHGGVAGIMIDTRRRPVNAASLTADRPSVSRRLRPTSVTEDGAHV